MPLYFQQGACMAVMPRDRPLVPIFIGISRPEDGNFHFKVLADLSHQSYAENTNGSHCALRAYYCKHSGRTKTTICI